MEVERGKTHPPTCVQPQWHAEQQHEVRDESQDGAAFDHFNPGGSAQYCTRFSTKRNCTTVSVITMIINTTDCADEPPRSPDLMPSW